MNKKYRVQLLAIGWVFTIIGIIQIIFLGLYCAKAQMILADLDNNPTASHNVEMLAAALAELIRIIMWNFLPICSFVTLAFGIIILRAVILGTKCGEQGVSPYGAQSAPPGER